MSAEAFKARCTTSQHDTIEVSTTNIGELFIKVAECEDNAMVFLTPADARRLFIWLGAELHRWKS